MTENEAQKWLERFEWDDSEETSEALATICEALQEYPKFRAIGTIEEFKVLKKNQRKCEDCAGCTTWKCDCANIRAKVIEEFAEKISLEISESIIYGMLFDNRYNSSYDTSDKIIDYVIDTAKKIAEQMKGGAE